MQGSKSAVYKGMMLESVKESASPWTNRSKVRIDKVACVGIRLDILAYSAGECDVIPEQCGCIGGSSV